MKSTSSVTSLRKWHTACREQGQRIALVPTMGALHEGHLQLVDVARKHADMVAMSIYVNPTQFGPKEDFSRYPRTLAADKKLAGERGVDIVFHPANLYESDHSVKVSEQALSVGRCGKSRPGHFDGVITVVAKLFNIVQPDVAVFGQKDGQQLDVIERLVRDLYFPIKIIRAPIVRDPRGVALSSRNRFLNPRQYEILVQFAGILYTVTQTESDAACARQRILNDLAVLQGLRIDYVEASGGRIFAAVKIGKTRFIDNQPLTRTRA